MAGVMRRHAYYDHDAAVAAIECLAEFGVTARMGPAIEYLAWGEEPTYEWTVIAPDLPDGPAWRPPSRWPRSVDAEELTAGESTMYDHEDGNYERRRDL